MKSLSAWIYAVSDFAEIKEVSRMCVKAHISWLSEVMNSTSRPGATPSETVVAGLFLIPFWSCGWFNKASLSGSFREPKTSVAVGGCKKRAKYTAFWRFRSDPERFCCVIKVHEENQHLEMGTKCKMKCIVVKISHNKNTPSVFLAKGRVCTYIDGNVSAVMHLKLFSNLNRLSWTIWAQSGNGISLLKLH